MRTEMRACLPGPSHKALSVNLGGFHHFNRETKGCGLGLKRTWKYTGGGQKKTTSVRAAAGLRRSCGLLDSLFWCLLQTSFFSCRKLTSNTFLFWIGGRISHYVALANLTLTMQTRLTLELQQPSPLPVLGWMTSTQHHAQLLIPLKNLFKIFSTPFPHPGSPCSALIGGEVSSIAAA